MSLSDSTGTTGRQKEHHGDSGGRHGMWGTQPKSHREFLAPDVCFLQPLSHTLRELLGSPGLHTQTWPLQILSPAHEPHLSSTFLHPAAPIPFSECPSIFAHSSALPFPLPAKKVPPILQDRRRLGSGPEQERPPPRQHTAPLSVLTIHVLHGVHAQAGIQPEPQPAPEPEESAGK